MEGRAEKPPPEESTVRQDRPGAGRTQRTLEMGTLNCTKVKVGGSRDPVGWGISSWGLQEPAWGGGGEDQPLHDARHQATVSPNPLFRPTHSRNVQKGVSGQGVDDLTAAWVSQGIVETRAGFQSFTYSLFHVLIILGSTNNCDHGTSLSCLIMGPTKMSTKSNDTSTMTSDRVLRIMEPGGRRCSEVDRNVF